MNGRTKRRSGLTLIEMTVVLGAVVILIGFGIPAMRSLLRSFESAGGTRSMIGAALNSARAMAVKDQRYTGVRFQMRCVSGNPDRPIDGLLDAPQYMVFIVHEEPAQMGGLANGFRAATGIEPIKLPQTIGVMDLSEGSTDDYGDPAALNDALTFSIVFSPSGKLTIHDVQTRNREGRHAPDDLTESADEVFNSPVNIITNGRGMFVQDDDVDAEFGFGREPSRTNFVLYDRQKLRALLNDQGTQAGDWDDYFSLLIEEGMVHVSPHTGALISSD